jgi:hypothetical protein
MVVKVASNKILDTFAAAAACGAGCFCSLLLMFLILNKLFGGTFICVA